RGGMEARLRVAEPGERRLIVEADSRRCELQVIDPGGAVVLRRSVKADEGPVALDVAFAQPGLHVLTVTANFTLTAPTDLPMAVEASPTRPLHAGYSGGHAFYVPADVEKLLLNVEGRLSLIVPGQGRVDLSGADVDPQLGCVAFDVPETARGAVWQTFH